MKCAVCGAAGLGLGAVPLQRVDRQLYCKKCLPTVKGQIVCTKCGRKAFQTNDYFVTVDGAMLCETCELKMPKTATASSPSVVSAPATASASAGPGGLVEALSGGLKKALDGAIPAGEPIVVSLNGSAGEAVVATDRRVIILKAGMAAGSLLGQKANSFEYSRITGVDVDAGLVYGRLQVRGPGTAETSEKDINAAKQADNAVTFLAAHKARFEAAAEEMRKRLVKAGV